MPSPPFGARDAFGIQIYSGSRFKGGRSWLHPVRINVRSKPFQPVSRLSRTKCSHGQHGHNQCSENDF